jgi:lysophospholipase L1-like esterase
MLRAARQLIPTIVAALIVVSPGTPVAQRVADQKHWVATWASSQTLVRGTGLGGARLPTPASTAPSRAQPPQQAGAPGRRFPVPPMLPSIANQTVRMIARVSLGGSSIRVRLSNAFGAEAVPIGAARIARSVGGSAIDAATSHALTFSGHPTATLYGGQVLVSDPVDLTVQPLADLAISVHVRGEISTPTQHLFGLRSTFISSAGDFTIAPDLPLMTTTQSYYWLAGIDVLAPSTAGVIVTFGDSITDGDQSTPEKLASWPSVLAARLQAPRATASFAVVNAGISGNRLLGDDGSGIVRVDRDAFSQPGVTWITLLEGINDITSAMRQSSTTFSADELIAAYRQVIAQAHARGILVAGCTLTPFEGSSAYSDAGERIRAAVNDWIRTSRAFDAAIDFDRMVRDPANPHRFRPEADSPDLLHPGDAGYKLMADGIDLRIFGTASRARRPD